MLQQRDVDTKCSRIFIKMTERYRIALLYMGYTIIHKISIKYTLKNLVYFYETLCYNDTST